MDITRIIKDWQRRNRFGEMVYLGEDPLYDSSRIPRLYVLVRDDILPPIHQGIQSTHACITLAHNMAVSINPKILSPKTYLVLLGASYDNMYELAHNYKGHIGAYRDRGLIDPETGDNPLTAVAFEPMSVAKGNKMFGHLKRSE